MSGTYRNSFDETSNAPETELIGGTDQTKIGNIGDRLKVDIASISTSSISHISRQDVSTTATASGTSATLDTGGMGTGGWTLTVTSASGTNPTLQVYIEESDDGVAWSRFIDTRRITAADTQRMQGFRLSAKYYRFGWIIGGTSPSFTFTIQTTLKPYMIRRYTIRNNYQDINIDTLSNVSTIFSAADVTNVSLFTIRAEDGGSSTQYVVQGSNDNFTWVNLTGNITQARNTTVLTEFNNKAFRNYRIKITAAANVSSLLDLFWAGTG